MTVEPISGNQPCTPLKAAATTAGVAAVLTTGLVAGHKTDAFHKISEKIKSEGKVQKYAKKALEFLNKAAERVTPKIANAFKAVKQVAKNIFGEVATVADRVIKKISGSLDKFKTKVNPEKFAEGAAIVDEKLAEAFLK